MTSAENLGIYERPLQYAKVVGPQLEEITGEMLAEVGINCQLFAHWVLEELCLLAVPKDYLSSHFWADTSFMRSIDLRRERLQFGDVVFFYRHNFALPENLHLAVVTDKNERGELELLHCVKRRDTQKPVIVSWTLHDFFQSRCHQHIYGARRITVQKQTQWPEMVDFDAKREWIYSMPFGEVLEFTIAQPQ